MQEKYEKMFYEFEPEHTDCPEWLNSPQAYFRGERSMPGSNLNVGYQVITGPVFLEQEPRLNREDIYYVFLGSKLPDVFSSWDAEIHFYLGPTLDTMEKVVITEPTVIKVPRSWWHSPLNFVRVDKPLLFQEVLHSGRDGYVSYIEKPDGEKEYIYTGYETGKDATITNAFVSPYKHVEWNVINEDGVTSYTDKGAYDPSKSPMGIHCVVMPGYESKPYSDAATLKAPKPALSPEVTKLVLAAPKEETKWGAWCPSPQFYFRGTIYMENATYNIGYQIFTAANDMEDPHIHQGLDEYIFFMGADPANIFDFDAEIEIFYGEDPDNLESRLITRPTVVRIPANMWHCPIRFRKMNKPIIFQAAFLDGTWGTIVRLDEEEKTEEELKEIDSRPFGRTRTYEYMGDNVRFCKYNVKKRCNICGECFPPQELEGV